MATEKRVRHILSLSGGKDSAALALYMRDRVPDMEYMVHLREVQREHPSPLGRRNGLPKGCKGVEGKSDGTSHAGTQVFVDQVATGWADTLIGERPDLSFRIATKANRPSADAVHPLNVVSAVGSVRRS